MSGAIPLFFLYASIGLHKENSTLNVLCHDFIQCSVDDAFLAWLKEEEDEAPCY